jgi:hypothetical protein
MRWLLVTALNICLSVSPGWAGRLSPFVTEDVVAVWKSESDLEKALNEFSAEPPAREAFDPYIQCWADAGTPAILQPPPASPGLVHIQIEDGELAGCNGIVLREEYVPD